MNIKDDKSVYFPRQFINKFKEKNDNIVLNEADKKKKLLDRQLEYYSKNNNVNNIIKKDKIVYINIDSASRNKTPKNIIQDEYNFLKPNPISVDKDSNTITVIQDNSYTPEDKIAVINVDTETEIYNNCLTFINNSNYVIIKHHNHQITSDYKKYLENFYIRLDFYDNLKMIKNVPINLLNGIHDIQLFNSNSEFLSINDYYLNEDPIIKYIDNYIDNNNISIQDFNQNNYLIKLPIKFKTESINDNAYIYPENVGIKIMNIGGIPLNEINANFPLSPLRKHGNQNVNYANSTMMTFNVDVKAYKSVLNTGGSKVIISKIVGFVNGYLNSSNYVIRAKTPLYNIKEISLVSMEFPFFDTIINSNNNKLYWKKIDDGDKINQIAINVGNYDINSLPLEIANSIENSTKIYNGDKLISYNTFNVKINTEENETTFESYNIFLNFVDYYFEKKKIDEINYIMIVFSNPYVSYLDVSDKINIENYIDQIGIPSNIINKEHIIFSINGDALYIKLDLFPDIDNIDFIDKYLPIKIWIPIFIQLTFSYSDTFGKLIGFNDVGEHYAITQFNKKISNKDSYNQTNFSFDKDTNINLTGFENYCYLYLNSYNNIITTTTQTPIFYKIQLSGDPGDILFNPYVDTPLVFDVMENQITEFEIKFLDKDGNLLNFNNANHSFTLKITEEISNPVKTLKLNNTENLKKLENEII